MQIRPKEDIHNSIHGVHSLTGMDLITGMDLKRWILLALTLCPGVLLSTPSWITRSSFHKKLSSSLVYWHNNRAHGNAKFRTLTIAGIAWYMVWPGRNGIVYGMAGRAWHGIWYGLGGHGMVYGITWVDMAWYMVWPGGHGMVYVMAWRAYGMDWRTWHGLWYGLAGIL